MQRGWSYIKDSRGFIKKTRNLGSTPEHAILVTVDLVGLYLSTPHQARSKAVLTNELITIANFVLKNNYFEFNKQIKQ